MDVRSAGPIFTITFLLLASVARAEYRLFDLEITDQTTGLARHVVSNLDDLQYRGYYPVRGNETIKIADTWICYKNQTQNMQAYCPSPRAPASPVVK